MTTSAAAAPVIILVDVERRGPNARTHGISAVRMCIGRADSTAILAQETIAIDLLPYLGQDDVAFLNGESPNEMGISQQIVHVRSQTAASGWGDTGTSAVQNALSPADASKRIRGILDCWDTKEWESVAILFPGGAGHISALSYYFATSLVAPLEVDARGRRRDIIDLWSYVTAVARCGRADQLGDTLRDLVFENTLSTIGPTPAHDIGAMYVEYVDFVTTLPI